MQLGDRIGRRMKIQDLHVLMTVVQAGSMMKAAALLNTSQPAISRSIADLEDAIGVRLLDRTPQGVKPTGYGRALLDGGAAMFDELRLAVKNIEFLADPTVGEDTWDAARLLQSSLWPRLSRDLAAAIQKCPFISWRGHRRAATGTQRTRNELAVGPGPVSDEKFGNAVS